jgi:tetratricopeptide (TPR) repeat protein
MLGRTMEAHLKQLLVLGREHFEKREFDKADYLLRQVAAESDGFADVCDMLGVIAHGRSDFEDAQHWFERAVELNPNYTEAQLNLMVTYNDLGKYDAAREIYGRIRHRAAADARVADPFARGRLANMHAELAQAYQDVGLPQDARRELERAVALCPAFADLRTRLGTLYRDLGDVELAREQYLAARAANPSYHRATVLLGVLELSQGDAALAERYFGEVTTADPEHKSAQMYLRVARQTSSRASGSDG